MEAPKHLYVPVIRVLEGEVHGVQHVSSAAASKMQPWFRIVRQRGRAPLSTYLGRAVGRIERTWASRGPCYVEVERLPDIPEDWADEHPICLVFRALHDAGVDATPVVATHLADEHVAALDTSVRISGNRVAFRLYEDDLEDSGGVAAQLVSLMSRTNTRPEDLHLLIDLERILLDRIPALRALVLNFLTALDSRVRYSSVTLLGSSMPADLDGIPKNEVRAVPRHELRLWREVSLSRSRAGVIRFGDHGIVRADYVDIDGPFPHINAKLCYTLEDATLVLRGQSQQDERLEYQYARLVRKLVATGEFRGAGYCWADRRLEMFCSAPAVPGTPRTYISLGTCHHLELAAAQVTRELAALHSEG
jgi:hypothetical protein